MELLKVTSEFNNYRIDKFIVNNLPQFNRTFVQKLILQKNIMVNQKYIAKNYRVKTNEDILINIPPPVNLTIFPEKIPINIKYEDDDLIVVNKDKGLVVHPAPGNYSGTLVNALLYYCKDNLSSINGVIRPGIVHRLDKDTSGLMVVAKNDNAHWNLSKQLQEHKIIREYYAIVKGHLKLDYSRLEFPIGRNRLDRKKMCVTSVNSKYAVTNYYTISRKNNYSLIKCILETGRTHQIRVHMSHIGYPILGDVKYGYKDRFSLPFIGQCLHSKSISFMHPTKLEYMNFVSDFPDYFMDILKKLDL